MCNALIAESGRNEAIDCYSIITLCIKKKEAKKDIYIKITRVFLMM